MKAEEIDEGAKGFGAAWEASFDGDELPEYPPHIDPEEVEREAEKPNRRVKLTRASDVKTRKVQWLWRHVIPSGTLSLIAGLQDQGKSYMTCDMAARVSTGRQWCDGSPNEPGEVLFMIAEDTKEEVVVPRLKACGADLDRVSFIDGEILEGRDHYGFIRLTDLDLIKESVDEVRPRLMLIDPVGSFIGGKDAYRDNEVRDVLAPLSAMAERHGTAIVFVAHHGKMQNARCADDLVLGSRAFTALSRVTYHVFKQDDTRYFLPGKNNLTASKSGYTFEFEKDDPHDDDELPRLNWSPVPTPQTADDWLSQQQPTKPGGSKVELAKAWLLEYLGSEEALKEEVVRHGKIDGDHSQRTLEVAAKALRVIRGRNEDKKGTWRLP